MGSLRPLADPCNKVASRVSRSLLEKIWRTPLTEGEAAIASLRARPRGLSGQSATGIRGSIATSGWWWRTPLAFH